MEAVYKFDGQLSELSRSQFLMFCRILTAVGVEWAVLVGRAMTAVTAILGAGDSSLSARDTAFQGRDGTLLQAGRLM